MAWPLRVTAHPFLIHRGELQEPIGEKKKQVVCEILKLIFRPVWFSPKNSDYHGVSQLSPI